jgi:glycosyltransferase involved in cell wall biosynthesis
MDTQTKTLNSVPAKPRAVVCGGGIGMFPHLMQRFRDEFDIVASITPHISPWYAWWYRLVSMRWPRHVWYRKWRYHLEKTPTSFRMLSKDFARQIAKLDDQYDVILFLGAMFSPGEHKGKRLFVFTDSCRWLSSRNVFDEISHFANPVDEKTWFALEGQVYNTASRIFVGSDFVRDALISHYNVRPESAVTTGFGAAAAFGEPYEKKFDGNTILYIGKGDFEKKGGMLLMKAFERVRDTLPSAQLHIVGQDRLQDAKGVINHGFVSDRARLVELMRSAHVFALPSLVDRNPISILEAMATSTPCIASDYGAMPGMVDNAGIITPCEDVEALASALINILSDHELARKLGENGRRRYETIYNWDSVWHVIQHEMNVALGRNDSKPSQRATSNAME